jgi:hypothetical protein
MLELMLDHPNVTLAGIIAAALICLAFFLGWLDRLIVGPAPKVAPPLGDAHDDVTGAPDEPDDSDRELNPATRPAGLTLDEVVAKAQLADRVAVLAADAALRYGAKLVVGEVRPDYEPPAAEYREEDPDEVDGEVVEDDEDAYPRAGETRVPAMDRAVDQPQPYREPETVPLYGSGPDLSETSIAWRFDSGLFRIVEPAGVSS